MPEQRIDGFPDLNRAGWHCLVTRSKRLYRLTYHAKYLLYTKLLQGGLGVTAFVSRHVGPNGVLVNRLYRMQLPI